LANATTALEANLKKSPLLTFDQKNWRSVMATKTKPRARRRPEANMGSKYIPSMPATARWRKVITSIGNGAAIAVVAAETSKAAVNGIALARSDPGLVKSFSLLVDFVLAARADNLGDALSRSGIFVSNDPDIYDIAAGYSAAVDRHLLINRGRSDIGEMAQLAGVETLNELLEQRTTSLFGRAGSDVKTAAQNLSTEAGFGRLVHAFFSRFMARFLKYHIDREIPRHVGVGRFASPDAHTDYLREIDTHSRATTEPVTTFAKDWYSKHRYLNDFSSGQARGFVNHTIDKLEIQLAIAGGHGE